MLKPDHENIRKYGYSLSQRKSTGAWYASSDTQKGTAWYVWQGTALVQIPYQRVPNDLIAH